IYFQLNPDAAVIRILLMGRNTCGKSSSGNLILGEKRFKRHESGVCEGQTQIRGQQVNGGTLMMKQMQRSNSMDVLNVSCKLSCSVNYFSNTRNTDPKKEIPERKDQIRLVLLGKTGLCNKTTVSVIKKLDNQTHKTHFFSYQRCDIHAVITVIDQSLHELRVTLNNCNKHAVLSMMYSVNIMCFLYRYPEGVTFPSEGNRSNIRILKE
uniref:AIG1-type G domain-containing protein n=1 Tax=Cyprinus carpio TaxID=7962 RepID=A0A8C1S431_CYPCA